MARTLPDHMRIGTLGELIAAKLEEPPPTDGEHPRMPLQPTERALQALYAQAATEIRAYVAPADST